MKHKLTLFSTVVTLGFACSALLGNSFIYEGFATEAFPAGEEIHNRGGGTGWDGVWAVSPDSQAPRYLASSYSLGYTAPSGQTLATAPGSMSLQTSGAGGAPVARDFASSISGEVWISFLSVRTSDHSWNWEFRFANEEGASQFLIRNHSASSQFQIFKDGDNQSANLQLSNQDLSADPVSHLYLVRLTNVGSGEANSEVTLYGNPAALAGDFDGTAEAFVTLSGIEVATLTEFAFDKGVNPTGYFDELRIGGSAADVLPIPEPTTFALFLSIFAVAFVIRRRYSA